ncbi:MAG: hypothetical protein FD168_2522 [Desulfobulbaceae bacterium]|nr:MAG: hypothetical protein FD168_2522 [Desulfobulbaceae bacterium]
MSLHSPEFFIEIIALFQQYAVFNDIGQRSSPGTLRGFIAQRPWERSVRRQLKPAFVVSPAPTFGKKSLFLFGQLDAHGAFYGAIFENIHNHRSLR